MFELNQSFQVAYSYPVIFTRNLFDPGNPSLREVLGRYLHAGQLHRLLPVLDEGVLSRHPDLGDALQAYLNRLPGLQVLASLILPGGEDLKNAPGYPQQILKAIESGKVDRHSYVLALGGGSLLDLAGYAAAIAHRGIRLIRVPSTVLSQNDSGVGVKNGINCFGKKNFLGTFAPPLAVFNDAALLETLEERDWRSGMAEAVKVALIQDAGFFGFLEAKADALQARDMGAMEVLIRECARLHLEHIGSGDPFEQGSSRPLDFGHWSAHKLEQLCGFRLRHGEAVAIGMALDVCYSVRIGWLEAAQGERILQLLWRLGFELYHPDLEQPALLFGLEEFREHLGGNLTIMLLRAIGKGENTHTINQNQLSACIRELRERQRNPSSTGLAHPFPRA